jgi:glycerophosphoryl diester phosphodiesterase
MLTLYLAASLKILRPFAKYYVRETNAGSVHVPYRWITNSPKSGKKFVSYVHSLGLKVAVYTPNSEKKIKASLEGGVDAVMSDESFTKILWEIINHKK